MFSFHAVCPTSAELPLEGQSVGGASSEQSEQVPLCVTLAERREKTADDDNELLSQKGAPRHFLHVVYVSRAAADADDDFAAAAAAPSTAAAAAAAGSATHAAARCNRPKKTGKKFRKTKTDEDSRVCRDGGERRGRRSALRAPRRAGAVHAVIARALLARCNKAHGVQKHKGHACILGSKEGIGSEVQFPFQ